MVLDPLDQWADYLRRRNRTIKACGIDGTFHKLRHRFATVSLAA